jgi:hypothetical protein
LYGGKAENIVGENNPNPINYITGSQTINIVKCLVFRGNAKIILRDIKTIIGI